MARDEAWLPSRAWYVLGLFALALSYGLVEKGFAVSAAGVLLASLCLLGFTVVRRAQILDPRPAPRPLALGAESSRSASGTSKVAAISSALCLILSVPVFLVGLEFCAGDSSAHAGIAGALAGVVKVVGILIMLSAGLLLLAGMGLAAMVVAKNSLREDASARTTRPGDSRSDAGG